MTVDTVKADEAWAWNVLAHHLPSDPTVWDPSAISAAIARHASDVILIADEPPRDVHWRAAALLHTLSVCPPLDSPMNEFYAATLTRSYLAMAGVKPLPNSFALADLVEHAKEGRNDVFATAEALRKLTD